MRASDDAKHPGNLGLVQGVKNVEHRPERLLRLGAAVAVFLHGRCQAGRTSPQGGPQGVLLGARPPAPPAPRSPRQHPLVAGPPGAQQPKAGQAPLLDHQRPQRGVPVVREVQARAGLPRLPKLLLQPPGAEQQEQLPQDPGLQQPGLVLDPRHSRTQQLLRLGAPPRAPRRLGGQAKQHMLGRAQQQDVAQVDQDAPVARVEGDARERLREDRAVFRGALVGEAPQGAAERPHAPQRQSVRV